MLLLSIFLSFAQPASAVTLDEAVRSAIQKNEAAQQSEEQLKQAQEKVSQATSAILPSLFLNATHQIQARPKDPLARVFSPEKQTTASLTLTQPIFRGFREFAGRAQRKDLLSAEEQRRVNTIVALYENVAASYLEVLATEQDLKNLNQQLALYKARVKELQARIRRGESRSTEALTAQSTEAALEAESRLVEAKLTTARENFSLLTALPADSSLTELNAQNKLRPLAVYLGRVEERPDIKEAKERVEASEEEVSVFRGAHWPTLDAVGNYYLKRPDGVLQDIDWDVQFRFSLPIFEGGLRVSETREASSRLRESELALSRLRREAQAGIRSLYHSLETREDQLAALKRSTELAEKNYEVLLKESRRGLSRSLDVQIALTDFRASRRNYDQARYAHQLDLLRLENAAAYFPAAVTDVAVGLGQPALANKEPR
jgi:outer membrane protein